MRYNDDWGVAMMAASMLVLAVLLSGRAAQLSGRTVRRLPLSQLAAPSSVAPERRRLVAAASLLVALAPQAWFAFLVVAQPFGLRDTGRAVLAGELALVGVWLVYLVRLPRDEGARRPGGRAPGAATSRRPSRGTGKHAREPEPRVAPWASTGVGVALLAVVAWAWVQPYGLSSFPPPLAIPVILMGASLVREGARTRGATRQPTRRR